eukprot:4223122-Pyramimonas_sp.AAC.1
MRRPRPWPQRPVSHAPPPPIAAHPIARFVAPKGAPPQAPVAGFARVRATHFDEPLTHSTAP